MGFQTSFDDSEVPIVVDASGAINLMATKVAPRVFECIPNRFVISDVVVEEIRTGRSRSRDDGKSLLALIEAGHIEVAALSEKAESIFEALVIGEAVETLDDGEAATMALAISYNSLALIDERKAIRIARERYSDLAVSSTVDLLAHPNVVEALGRENLSNAVVSALQGARMNVLPHRYEWIVDLIGLDRASRCESLPLSVRQPRK